MNEPTSPAAPAASFEALLAAVLDRAYGVAFHLTRSRDDAEDLVQEAALQAFKHFDQFQQGTNFKAWYLRILTNCFFASYRKKKRQPQMMNLEDAEPLYLYSRTMELGIHEGNPDPATLVLGRLGEQQVQSAIHALPEEFRIVCSLYFLEDMAYQEIAEIIECPVGTVRSRLHRGRKLLQRELWSLAEASGVVAQLAAREGAQ